MMEFVNWNAVEDFDAAEDLPRRRQQVAIARRIVPPGIPVAEVQRRIAASQAPNAQFLRAQPRLPQPAQKDRPRGRPPKGATWDEQTGQYRKADGQPHQWDSTNGHAQYVRDWVAAIKKDDPVRHQKMKDRHAKRLREARKRIREEDPELAKKIREDNAKAKRKARSK